MSLKLGQKIGFENLTVETLARHSGAARTTIYRRWPNISAILMDAILSQMNREAPIQEKATVRKSFEDAMKLLVEVYAGPHGKTLRTLIGRAQFDERLGKEVATRWVVPRRKLARELLRLGMDRGEIRPDVDPDIILDSLYGPIYHRMLVPYENASLDGRFVEAVVEITFEGVRPKG